MPSPKRTIPDALADESDIATGAVLDQPADVALDPVDSALDRSPVGALDLMQDPALGTPADGALGLHFNAALDVAGSDPVIRPERTSRWTVGAVEGLFDLSFADLLYRAQIVHRAHHTANSVQLSTLLSIKTGGCPEDCGYCPQAKRYHTGVEEEPLLALETVVAAAEAARASGATRFCMGAAWRGPKQRDLDPVLAMVRSVKALGLETCATLGMLKEGQAEQLVDAGLDYYNHNLDTAPEFYGEIVSTRNYADRLETLSRVRASGLRVCCGGIVGMGESRRQRAALVAQLANLDPYPESVPINHLVQVEGTPLHGRLNGDAALDPLEFVRTVAVARITMPKAMVRLSAGRREQGEAIQALCFLAGANSIFYGERLLTTANPDAAADRALLDKLGLNTQPVAA